MPRHQLFVIMAVVGAASAVGSDATACSCPPSQCGDIATADAVFVATIARNVPLYQMNSQGLGDRLIGRIAYLDDIRQLLEETTTTDSDGNYGFTKLPVGRYTVSAAPPPDRKGLIAIPDLDVTVDVTHRCAMANFMARNDGRISGRVVDATGAPMPALLVYLQPLPYVYGDSLDMGSETDAAGQYQFTEVPEGRYRVGINFLRGPDSHRPYPTSAAKTASGSDVVSVGPG